MSSRKPVPLARHTFIEFCARENSLTREQAAYEFDNFLTINGYIRLRDSYLTVFRGGASFFMPRRERAMLYLTFENACAHAAYAEEHPE